MKTVLLTVAALCAAALFGLAPPRAVAGDPASDAAVAVKDANTQPDSTAQAQPAAKKAAAGQDAASGQDARRAASRSKEAAKPTGRPLDLSTPPVSHVMTPEQVQALTAQPDEDDSQEVMVEEERYTAPVPRGQIRALAWALMHPLSAWRIFTPVTDE